MRAIAPKWTGRIWPTGKFGVSRVRETFFPAPFCPPEPTGESEWRDRAIRVHGLAALAEYEGKPVTPAIPDLSNVPKSPIRSKRGQKGITQYGRNLISSAAVVAERNYDRRQLTFATVTLPSAPIDSLRSLSADWSAIVKRFGKCLTRGLAAKRLPSWWFGVTEIQMKRFERSGVPALHLHFVFVGRNSRKSAWQVDRKNIRRWWKQAIAPYLPPDTDYSSVENVGRIVKSAASYLGKYMSKGVAAIEKIIEAGYEDWLPSAWYTISHSFRRLVLSQVLRGEDVGMFLNWLCHNVIANWVEYVCPVMARSRDGTGFSVGFSGRLSRVGLDKVHQIVI